MRHHSSCINHTESEKACSCGAFYQALTTEMTVEAHFAAAAMTGMLARGEYLHLAGHQPEWMAASARRYAEAMMNEFVHDRRDEELQKLQCELRVLRNSDFSALIDDAAKTEKELDMLKAQIAAVKERIGLGGYIGTTELQAIITNAKGAK